MLLKVYRDLASTKGMRFTQQSVIRPTTVAVDQQVGVVLFAASICHQLDTLLVLLLIPVLSRLRFLWLLKPGSELRSI